jgi:glycosyltransferase involved in cell wall biosynthesis
VTTPVPERPTIAVHPHADLYGSDRMFLASVEAIGPDVLVVLSKQGPLVDEVAKRGIAHQIMDFPVLRKVELRTPWKALVFLVRFLRSVAVLTAWLRARRPAVLYVSTIAAPEWLLAGRLSRTRVVCHLHEAVPEMSRTSSALLLSPLLAADLVLANSEGTLAWIRSSLGDRVARRSRVLHNGVREPAWAPVAHAGAPSDAHRLVLVGRLSAIKGQDIAIRATALVRQAGFDVALTLVGDGYPGYEDLVEGLHSLAAAEGIADITDFTGFQDPTPYVAEADVVLIPSRVESFGLVAVEALLLGRPVVATRIGGLPEVIRDGETGVLIEPDDPQALAAAVIHLLAHPDEAAALGRAGLVDARARFSIEAYAAGLSEAVLQAS